MSGPITVGNITVNPGETKRGAIVYGVDMTGAPRTIPIIVLHGAEPGPRLWLNGATHGDEPEGPYSIFLALRELDANKLRGTVVAVPVMNTGAFAAGQRGDPLDTFAYDMNRIYPGKATGYPSERMAAAHWAAMKDTCDLQIAIHSGGEHSFLSHMTFAADNAISQELGAAMGPNWDLIFRSAVGTGNPSSMVGSLGKGAITVELGGNCRLLTADFQQVSQDLADGYLNVMRHFKMIDGAPKYAPAWRQGYQIALLSPASGMFVGTPELPFETELPEGTLLGVIYNLYGDIVAEVRAPQKGVVFGLRSRASTLEGQWCCFFGVVEQTVDNLLQH